MKIRAAVLERSGLPAPYAESRPLAIRAIELAPPGLGEVMIRIDAAGLCHSDLSVIDGNRPRPLPMALGHEAAGTVIETGAGVDDLAPGDQVVCVFVPSCGTCLSCAEGRPALCEPGASANGAGTLLSGARRLVCEGEPINHHLGVSALRDACDGLAVLAGQGRPRPRSGACGAVRLRGAHRRRGGVQRRPSEAGHQRRGDRARRRRARGAPRRARRRRRADHRR